MCLSQTLTLRVKSMLEKYAIAECKVKDNNLTSFQQFDYYTAIRKLMLVKKGVKRYYYVLSKADVCLKLKHK